MKNKYTTTEYAVPYEKNVQSRNTKTLELSTEIRERRGLKLSSFIV